MILALLVFILTYALISIRRFKKFRIERPAAALLGAALMVLLTIVTPNEAINAVRTHLDTIILLLGMMMLVVILEFCGFFDLISLYIVKHAGSPFRFLVLLMVVTGTLSALILNDTVVLLFTPILIKSCRLIKTDPVPYLIAEAFAANIGSVATPIGNPQNAYIAIKAGISFTTFTAKLFPVAVVCLFIGIIVTWFVFKRGFTANTDIVIKRSRFLKLNWYIFKEEIREQNESRYRDSINGLKNNKSLYLAIGILVAVFVGFLIIPEMSIVAIIGGCVAMFFIPLLGKVKTRFVLKNIDWGILLFFAGLFVVLAGVEKANVFSWFEKGYLQTAAPLSMVSAILSNLISNVPAVMLIASVSSYQLSQQLWLVLAASSTLAGNATILGAAANIIVAEAGSVMGVEIGFWKFMKAGIIVTVLTLIVSILMLSLI
jgi:Na+/H+ antiporter NhaD/arsenite permease-like protein